MTARRHSSGRSPSTGSPEGQHAWPSGSRTSRVPGPRNEYFRVRVEFILWTDDVWLPRIQNHRVLAVAARSGHQSGHGTRVTPASLLGPADGQRPRRSSRSEPNCRASTRPKSRKFNRGARIRTGDLLLPKQARYRTAPRPVHPSTACLTPYDGRWLRCGPTAWMHAVRWEPPRPFVRSYPDPIGRGLS